MLLIAAPRVGWEEKQLLQAARDLSIAAQTVAPGAVRSYLGAGGRPIEPPVFDDARVVLMRCPGYFQSIELAAAIERHGLRAYNTSEHLTTFGRKTLTDAWLAARGLPLVPSCLAFSADALDDVVERLGLPLVVKPSIGGFGRRVQLVETKRELVHAWEYLEDFAPSHHQVLYVQRWVDVAHDVRVNLVDGKVVGAIERVNEHALAKNVALGATGVPYRLEGSAHEVARALADALPRGFFGADLLVTKAGQTFVCELNASCSFREASTASRAEIAREVVLAATREEPS